MTVPSWLMAVRAVWLKELRVLFLSPLATVFLAGCLMLGGLFFTLGVSLTGEASLRNMMPNLGAMLLFTLPLLTMRAYSEEERSGTLELLMTVPVGPLAILLGKWLAAMVLCTVFLAFATSWGWLLAVWGDPDIGVLATSYLGLGLCCAAFSAVGLFASSLTRDQMVAGVLAVCFLLPSWLAGAAREFTPASWQPVLDRLSFTEHLRGFARGVIDSADVLWFVAFTAVFLLFTWQSVESRRWR